MTWHAASFLLERIAMLFAVAALFLLASPGTDQGIPAARATVARSGHPVHVPDELERVPVRIDVHADGGLANRPDHCRVLHVGFHNLVSDFVISNSPHERSWTIVAQREPSWDLPLVAERFIRTPLHRPFEGAGSMFRLSIFDSVGTQTLFARRTRLDVQESTIMRFLGSLASHAIGDLEAKVELEEDRFLRDAFTALQADLRAASGRWAAENQ